MRPRVGISRCLLGDEVRYDGTHKLSAPVMALSSHVEWVPVCPEVEVGMRVPREPIRLAAHADGVRAGGEWVRLTGVRSGEDWTERMEAWASQRIAELRTLGLNGFVLKARSPSCGPGSVLMDHDAGEPTPTGRGLFAEALVRTLPGLPIEDEERLEDPRVRELFLKQVRDHAAKNAAR